MDKHLASVRLAAILVNFYFFFAGLNCALAQATGRANLVCSDSLRRFKLISPGIGWLIVDQPLDHAAEGEECTRQHLYWTETNGRTWREITPPDMPTRNIGQIFFLDRSHGWLLSTDALSEEENARFYLLSTEDAGMNWRTLVLQRPTFQLRDDYTFPSQLFFSDSQHGWVLWHWAMMNSQLNYLLATADGGRTWKRLPDPPGPGPLQFMSATEGWMIGGLEVPNGIPDPETENLWATHDGGKHWRVLPAPATSDTEHGEVYFSDIKFKTLRHGLAVAGGRVSDYLFRFFTCETSDGGKSWRVFHFDAYHASPSFVGDHIVWSVSDWPEMKTTLQTKGRVTSPTPPSGLSLEGRFGDFDFVDDSNGWTFCDRELLSTSDGGKTLHVITPPQLGQSRFPPPQLFAVNGIMLRFPPTLLMPQGFRAPAQPPGSARRPLGPAAGGPLQITGTGFLSENTVWIGTRQVQGSSEDGKRLVVNVPSDVLPGTYDVYIENAHGKTEAVPVNIRPAESLRISGVYNGDERYRDRPYRLESGMHRGQKVVLPGSGFSLENTVWFGAVSVQTRLVVSGGAGLEFAVPESLAPGKYELYVTNANGKSNVLNVVVLE